MRAWLGIVVAIAACDYTPPGLGGIDAAPADAPPDVVLPPPDAAVCLAPSADCVNINILRTCSGPGVMAVDTQCIWGCNTTGTAHCSVIVPTGGGVEGADLPQGIGDLTLAAGADIDSTDGTIAGFTAGTDFQFEVAANNVAIFKFNSLVIDADILLTGTRPIALVANGMITVNGEIDARGGCVGRTPGPGGAIGATAGSDAVAPGGGQGAGGNDDGGGGAGYGGTGGSGNGGQPGGGTFGDDAITILRGGAGGGGGKAGQGGGGGGAIQLVSNVGIVISATGAINAGGCGPNAGAGGSQDGGGGGGSGGTIVLEAPTVTIAGVLAVNGGAGADKDNPGGDGNTSRTPAFGAGADGSAGANLTGGNGQNSGDGGGGGIGRIRVNTRLGTATLMGTAVLSPSFIDNPTTATQSTAAVQ